MRKNIIIIILGMLVCVLLALRLTTPDTYINDHVETERKFLLNTESLLDFDSLTEKHEFVQTYINYSPEMRVRKVTNALGVEYYFTIKLPQDEIGLSRHEIEVKITEQEYEELLKKQVGTTIYKTRYQFVENGFYMSVDVYSHELLTLSVAEVEFSSVAESEKYSPPSWFGEEVTSDKRYKNANLAKDGLPR